MKDKDKQDLQKQIDKLRKKIGLLILSKEIKDSEEKDINKKYDELKEGVATNKSSSLYLNEQFKELNRKIKIFMMSDALINGVNNACKEFEKADKERYPMCKDQPAQIDCRQTACMWHVGLSCTNISPAITLTTSGKYTCRSDNVEMRSFPTGGIVPSEKDKLIQEIESIVNKGYVHYSTINHIINKYK